MAPPSPPPGTYWAYWLIAVATVVGLALAVKGTYAHKHAAQKLVQRRSILVAGFTNTTSGSDFDGTLRHEVSAQLRESPSLSLVSNDEIAWALQMMHEPPGSNITGALAREVCRRIGSAAVIEGSIAGVGSEYLIGLRAVDCRTSQMLAQVEATAANQSEVSGTLSRVAATLRGRLDTRSLPPQ